MEKANADISVEENLKIRQLMKEKKKKLRNVFMTLK